MKISWNVEDVVIDGDCDSRSVVSSSDWRRFDGVSWLWWRAASLCFVFLRLWLNCTVEELVRFVRLDKHVATMCHNCIYNSTAWRSSASSAFSFSNPIESNTNRVRLLNSIKRYWITSDHSIRALERLTEINIKQVNPFWGRPPRNGRNSCGGNSTASFFPFSPHEKLIDINQKISSHLIVNDAASKHDRHRMIHGKHLYFPLSSIDTS